MIDWYSSGISYREHLRRLARMNPSLKVNRRTDRIMKAPDMFAENVMQLFSVRTGDFRGYESNGIQSESFIFDDPAILPAEEISGEPENQLTLEL